MRASQPCRKVGLLAFPAPEEPRAALMRPYRPVTKTETLVHVLATMYTPAVMATARELNPDKKLRKFFLDLVAHPHFLENTCTRIASGESLLDIANEYGVPYGWITNWLRGTKPREDRWHEALRDKDELERDMVLREMKRIGFADFGDLIDQETGELKPLKKWPLEARRAIKSVKKSGEVVFHDKLAALKDFGKEKGMFRDRLEVTGTLTLEQAIAQSRQVEKKEAKE